MNLKEKYLVFIPQTLACDKLKINYLNDNDINICNYVSEQIPYLHLPLFKQGKRVPLNNFTQMSLEQIKILGEDTYSKAIDLIPKIPIYSDKHYRSFNTLITYSTSPKDGHVITNSGTIVQYNIPKIIYDSDITFLSHEHCHSLKDTNYEEYINLYTLGEIIPIFYELIANEQNDAIKRRILQIRMHYLHSNKTEFQSASKIVETHTYHKRSVYNYVQSRAGCYLNSFYYALILYNMYKETPIKILTLIYKVLNHEITTYEMLIHLDIHGEIKGQIFEKELNGIKKVLKK